MHFECAIKVEKCFVSIDLFTNHLLFLTVANLYFSAIQTEQRIDTLAEKEALWET